MIIDLRKDLPINFFFYKNKKGKICITLNGSHYPDKKTLKEMSVALDKLLLISKKEFDELNKKITKRQQKDEQEYIEQEKSNNKVCRQKEGYVYLIKSLGLYKIGRCENPNRIKTYRTENPHKIELIFQQRVSDCIGTEKLLLKKYFEKKYKGEWFKLSKSDVLDIKKFLSLK